MKKKIAPPATCDECCFNGACMSAMYLDGCRVYPPNSKPKSLIRKLFDFFKKK